MKLFTVFDVYKKGRVQVRGLSVLLRANLASSISVPFVVTDSTSLLEDSFLSSASFINDAIG